MREVPVGVEPAGCPGGDGEPAAAGLDVPSDREADVRTVVIMVSDRSADGRDVSWIWDADVESMVDRGIRVVAGGTRAAEVAIRIKYAGGEVIAVEPDAARALSAGTADTSPEEAICVLATYTAMLEVRRAILESRVARVGGVVA